MALISCRDLMLGYEGKNIIQNLNLEINSGDYLCILGENGAGKTTLMKNILGISKPIGGLIEFGEDMLQNQIGYIPQQSSAQKDFPATVYEVVLSGCLNSHGSIAFFNAKDKKKVESNLSRLGIKHLQRKCYRELSGGQQQRVLLARALCATKRVIFLDEPMAGLDPKATQDFYELLKSLNEEGVTVVMISHDLNGVRENAKQVLYLTGDGASYGNIEEVFGRYGNA